MADVCCDYCSSIEFRFNGRHMICRKCGCVTGRSAPPLHEKERVTPKRPKRWRACIHYEVMKEFRHVLQECSQ